MRHGVLLVLAGLALPGLAQAQGFSGAERITQGDLTGAEREIARQRQLFPNDPDLLINLAHVYARTERTAEARALYRTVLTQPDEELTLRGGTAMSAHSLAHEGLRRISAPVLAAR